jgi:hypothetical protein
MKFYEKYKVDMLKIIVIISLYTLNKFHYSYHNIIVDDENNQNLIHFLKINKYSFCQLTLG